jgi:hypothetical protein
MTAHTPASKASDASALLASFSTVPPPPQPAVKEGFLAVMLQALIGGPGGEDHPPAAPPAQEKPSAKEAAAPDPTAASLLLALLAPPLPTLRKPPSPNATVPSVPVVPSDSAAPAAPAQAVQEKPSPTEAAPDPTAASLLLALLAPPLPTLPKPSPHKSSALSVPVGPSVPPSPPASAQTAGEAKPGKTDDTEKTPLLPAQAPPTKEPENKPLPTSGTSVASTSPRMSFLSDRNEIAGRMEQKLPPAAISAVSSADTGGPSPDGGAKSSLAFSWHDAPSEPLTIIDLSAKAAAVAAPVADTSVDTPERASSSASLERLEQMITREVVSVRQTGAQTLGVTLKLDTNTQLFLQLTTHNGLVQASVRCERGSFAPEDAQWAQLQQSLARQNVELLPMTGGANLNFQRPSDERPRQPAEREDWPAAGAAVPPAQPRQQQKEQNHSRKNWESWA